MDQGERPVDAGTFADLVATAVIVVETPRGTDAEAGSLPDPAVLTRLERGQGGIADLDAWREARGWDVGRLLDVLDHVLGTLDLLACGDAESATLAAFLADTAPGTGGEPGAAFPRLLRRSAYLPMADAPGVERLLVFARALGRALMPREQPPLALRVTGLASDLAVVAKDLNEVVKELRAADALVLGGRVVHQRKLLARVVNVLDEVATELQEGRLR